MRQLCLCGAAILGVLAGCSSSPPAHDAGAALAPEARKPQRLGAGDALGWSVHARHQSMTEAVRSAGAEDRDH